MNNTGFRSYRRYTDYDKEPGGLFRLDRIVDTLQRHAGSSAWSEMSVLEVGCGSGNISRALASLGCEVLGVDIDPNSIMLAQANNPFSNLRFEVQDVCQLSVSQRYDAVICSEIFEHLGDPLLLMQAVHDLLKPDRLMLATIPNGYGPEELVRRFLVTTELGGRIREILRRSILKHETTQTQNFDSPHVQYFSLGRFLGLVEQASFDVVQVCNWTAFFMQTYYIFLRLVVKRGSPLFRRLDAWDRALAERWPLRLGGGWFVAARRIAH
jgi:2-polyprenyl-3-methyl-5-hydroxy-6-metoxy-1,4-benzoquinol methylase